MRILTLAGSALAATASIAMLAGCSGGSSSPTSMLPGSTASQSVVARPSLAKQLPPSLLLPRFAAQIHPVSGQVASFSRPDAATAHVYSCQYYGSDCKVWNASNGSLIKTVTSGLSNPQGTVTGGKKSAWYIANTGGSNLPIYNAAGTHLNKTLNDSGQYPVDVSWAKGKVAVSNIFTTSFTAGSVSIYLGTSKNPSSNLTDSNAFQGIGIAQHGGNCYWSYNDNSGIGQIDVFTGCKGSATNLGLTLGFAGGVAFDNAGNMWYADQLAGLYKCSGTSSCTLVTTGFGDALMINFNKGDSRLYVADATGSIKYVNPASPSTINTFATLSSSDPPFGVAAGPHP